MDKIELSVDSRRNIYGNDIALLFQLEIIYDDGTTETVLSDNSWKSSTGAIRYAEIYNGETIDARLEKNGWALPGYNDKDWDGVKVPDHSKNILIATEPDDVHAAITKCALEAQGHSCMLWFTADMPTQQTNSIYFTKTARNPFKCCATQVTQMTHKNWLVTHATH